MTLVMESKIKECPLRKPNGKCKEYVAPTHLRSRREAILRSSQVSWQKWSIPVLEKAGYILSGHTKKAWVVFPFKGRTFVFKRDTGVCKGIPYIDLHTNKAGLVMINTVCKNFEFHAKKRKSKKLRCLATYRA